MGRGGTKEVSPKTVFYGPFIRSKQPAGKQHLLTESQSSLLKLLGQERYRNGVATEDLFIAKDSKTMKELQMRNDAQALNALGLLKIIFDPKAEEAAWSWKLTADGMALLRSI